MDQNTNNIPVEQPANMGANNQTPTNNLSLGGATKGCFGLSKAAMILIALAVILCGYGCSKRNSFVTQEKEVDAAWSKVEADYQRRSDLYTTIAANLKKYDKHERETYQGVTNARAGVRNNEQQDQALQQMQALSDSAQALKNVKVDPNDEQAIQNYLNSQKRLKEQLNLAINVVHEAYPDLKAEDLHKDFQAQMEGTENRINTSRKDYIEKVREYNTNIDLFPGNIVAGIFGFKAKPQFKAEEGTDKVPNVEGMLED
ncbi:MAG: LemA family protein [Muribaculaceae bacterium]|nr:LemA family protein [Muribaculaceae bacterium]